MRWRVLTLVLGVATASGANLAQAVLQGSIAWCWVGGLLLLAAVLLVLGERGLSRPRDQVSPQGRRAARSSARQVRLGELLLGQRLISRAQLEAAMLRHLGSGEPLGAELVKMGAISMAELARVLEKQRMREDRGFLWPSVGH
jgi:hypothetical protein